MISKKEWLEKALETIDNMTTEEFIASLEKAGYDVVAIPEKEQRIRNLEVERKVINEECSKLTKRSKELTTEIQSLCTHHFGEASYSDDHDGWSRCDYTQTKRETCTKCGLTNTTKKVCNY